MTEVLPCYPVGDLFKCILFKTKTRSEAPYLLLIANGNLGTKSTLGFMNTKTL